MAKTDRNKPLYMISVAADLAGLHPQTLRIYEAKGLVSPQRTSGNTRMYSQADVDRLELIGRLTDEGINLAGVMRPLKDGVIADFDVTEAMLRYFISRAQGKCMPWHPKPRVVVCVPSGVTSVEKRAVFEATITAGARQAFLIEEPMAAAIGAGLPVDSPTGSMVVDIGGGTTEVAVISMGGIVNATSIRIAGDAFDAAVVQYAKIHYNIAIGERTAEEIKITIGSAAPLVEEVDVEVRGRDLLSGLPRTVRIESEDVREALEEPIAKMIQAVKDTLDETPPDLASDLMEYGITLTGGGGMLRGLDERLRAEIGVPVHVSETALINVVEGCAMVLEVPDFLSQSYMQQR